MTATEVITRISDAYSGLISTLPEFGQSFVKIFLLVLLIVIYAIIIWKFYRFIGTKNLIQLNLNKYNRYQHAISAKLFGGFLYFIEYLIILPFLIFFWFVVFTILLILLAESIPVSTILLLSATIIGAIRMTSYIPNYGENLSKEVAKILPFTLLAISMTKPDFFTADRILTQLQDLPTFFSQIPQYLGIIILLEILLRFFDLIFSITGVETKKQN